MWAGGVRRDDVETFPSTFSSAVSPPRELEGLYGILPLPGVCYGAKVNGSQPYVPMY